VLLSTISQHCSQDSFFFLKLLLDLKRKYDPDDVFRSTIGHLAPHSLTR
jgi:hypothetical protein